MFDVIGDGLSGIFAVIHMLLFFWALINIFGSKMEIFEKIIWALAVLLLPVVGLIIYIFIGKKA